MEIASKKIMLVLALLSAGLVGAATAAPVTVYDTESGHFFQSHVEDPGYPSWNIYYGYDSATGADIGPTC